MKFRIQQTCGTAELAADMWKKRPGCNSSAWSHSSASAEHAWLSQFRMFRVKTDLHAKVRNCG